MHVASPFFIERPKHEDELIKPAVEGTLAVMKAAHQGKIKRVIVTSSIAAITGVSPENIPDDYTYTEEHWTDVNSEIGKGPYIKSKTLAEKAAWDFLKNLPEEERFEMATINPSFVVGPSLCGPGYTSMKVVADTVMAKHPGMIKIMMNFVDVREVAQAHIKALETPDAAGKRFITSAKDMWMPDYGQILYEEFGPKGYEFSRSEPPYCMMKFLSYFNSDVAMVLPSYGR